MIYIYLIILMFLIAAPAVAIPPPNNDLERKIDSLFIIASSGDIKYRDSVDQAIDSIAVFGAPAVPRLVETYTTQSARERHTINQILKKIGSDAVPYLTRSLGLDDPEQVSRICYSLGEIGDDYATKPLLNIIDYDHWWVRAGVAGALGKIGDTTAFEKTLGLFTDSIEMVRKSAVVAVGKMKILRAVPDLIGMFSDPYYGVRYTASEALMKMDSAAIPILVDSLSSDNDMTVRMIIYTLGKIGGDIAAEALEQPILSPDPVIRALAVEAIYDSDSSIACSQVELISDTETDPVVLYYIELVLDKYAAR